MTSTNWYARKHKVVYQGYNTQKMQCGVEMALGDNGEDKRCLRCYKPDLDRLYNVLTHVNSQPHKHMDLVAEFIKELE